MLIRPSNFFNLRIYTIIGPRTVQHRSTYKCVLTAKNFNNNTVLTIDLIGKRNGDTIGGTKVIHLNRSFGSKDLEFKVRMMRLDFLFVNPIFFFILQLSREKVIQNYTLFASVENSKTNETSDIIVIPKKYSIFIQTDKPVYNPGDELLYRVLVLDSDLKPYRAKEVKIEIYDGQGNFLPPEEPETKFQLSASKFKKLEAEPVDNGDGVFDDEKTESEEADASGESHERSKRNAESNAKKPIQRDNGKIFDGLYAYHYNISDEANQGIWSLKVMIDNETDFVTTKHFEVKEFILPRFEVIVETNREASETDSEIRLSVYANYTFNEMVTGEVTVTPTVTDPEHRDKAKKKAPKKATANFHADFRFQMREELNIINAIRPYEVTFDVEFMETLTGQKMKSNATVRVYKSSQYFIEIVRGRESFKPGFPFSFGVFVTDFNGRPASSQIVDLRVDIKYLLKARRCDNVPKEKLEGEETFFRVKQLENGFADFTLDVPPTATSITIEASYNQSKGLINVVRHQGQTDEYLIIEVAEKEKR